MNVQVMLDQDLPESIVDKYIDRKPEVKSGAASLPLPNAQQPPTPRVQIFLIFELGFFVLDHQSHLLKA
jgi:hypothetical protein